MQRKMLITLSLNSTIERTISRWLRKTFRIKSMLRLIKLGKRFNLSYFTKLLKSRDSRKKSPNL
jgi:hypothetical protein